jgi:hypothetical protein
MIWSLIHHPLPLPVSKLDWRHTGRLKKRDKLVAGEREVVRGGRGAESYDRKKAWFSVNHSILSGHGLISMANVFYM